MVRARVEVEDYGRTGTEQVTQVQRDFQLEVQERFKRQFNKGTPLDARRR